MRYAAIRTGLIIFACCGALFARSQVDPSKRLTLSLSCQSISALCSEISRQTGGVFVAEGPIAERKVTLACSDRPLGEIQDQIAQFLGAEWVQRANRKAIRLLPETLSLERRQLQLEENSMRASVRDVLKLLSWCAQNSPEALAEFRSSPKGYGGPPLEIYHPSELAFLSSESNLAEVSFAMQPNLERHLTDLLSGAVLGFSLEKRPGHILLPTRSTQPSEVESSPMALSFDPATRKLRFATMFRAPWDAEILMPMARDIALPTPKKLVLGPLAQREAEFTGVKLERLKSAVVTPLPALPRSPYTASALGLSEHAIYLASQFKMPVIADAFRVAVTGESSAISPSLETYCQNLVASSKITPLAAVIGCQESKGWLQMRHAQPWCLYGSEVPEQMLATMESRPAAANAPSLEDYANQAKKLTDSQRAFFEQRVNVLVRFPVRPLRSHIPMLAFWASLNAGQRTQAEATGLNISRLAQPQLNLLATAAQRAAYSSQIQENLYNRFSAGDFAFDGLSFFLKISQSTAQGFDTETLQLGASVPPAPIYRAGRVTDSHREFCKFLQGIPSFPNSLLPLFPSPAKPSWESEC